MKIDYKEYEGYRDKLLEWEWLTEVFNGKKSVYQPTKKGYMAYYFLLDAVGTDQLVNGFKVKPEELQKAKAEVGQLIGRTRILAESGIFAENLQQLNLLTKAYDRNEGEYFQLTPFGAKMLLSMFWATDKPVGVVPKNLSDYILKATDIMFKITEVMGKLSDNMAGKGGLGKDPFGMGKFANFSMSKTKGNRQEYDYGGKQFREMGDRMMNFGPKKKPKQKPKKKKKKNKNKKR